MFVSKKKYALVLTCYELAASRADRAERQLAEIDGLAQRNGGLYKCILECREAAQALAESGSEAPRLTTDRLAFIDRFLSRLLPVLSRRMPDRERLMWEDALKDRTAGIYGSSYRYCQPEEETL